MSNLEILYYPRYEPPSEWFRSFLLFYDCIKTIKPSNANYNPSSEISSILQLYPNALTSITPSNVDIDIDLQLLQGAFQLISEKNHISNALLKRKKTIKLIVDKTGNICVEGHAFLHQSKLSIAVLHLLREYNLVQDDISKITLNMNSELNDYYVVDEDASNLIVSCISNNITSRFGLLSATDIELDFAMNSINSFGKPNRPEIDVKSYLAKAIISLQVPQDISHLTPRQYKDIREAYTDIREPFQELIAQLCTIHNLNSISDSRVLEERIRNLLLDVDNKIEKIKRYRFIQNIRRWSPLYVGGLVSVLGRVYTGDPSLQVTTACTSFLIQLIQEIIKKPIQEGDKIYHLIGNLQEHIISDTSLNLLKKTKHIYPNCNPCLW